MGMLHVHVYPSCVSLLKSNTCMSSLYQHYQPCIYGGHMQTVQTQISDGVTTGCLFTECYIKI